MNKPIDESAVAPPASTPRIALGVIVAVSFCHLLNDMMQSLLPAIYPGLKTDLGLSFGQIGVVTLAYQITASILQPLVGLYADQRPTPLVLPGGTLFSLAGLLILAVAHSYGMVIAGACLLGVGSSVFHPESSRVARMASGGRHGLAQSLFQVGGNAGQALGPLAAALVVVRWGQSSLVAFGLLALLAGGVLWNVAIWYRKHGLPRMKAAAAAHGATLASHPQAARGTLLLLALVFSKYVYLASLTSYFTFYLIERFAVSVRDAQLILFAFLAAVAVGTIVGGPLGDRFGRKPVIWFSILGTLPFTLVLPHVDLAATVVTVVIIGLVLASAFPAIVVFAQELMPGKVGMVSGLFFGFSFGMGGLGAAGLGWLADHTSITTIYEVCAFLPAIGLLAIFLPAVRSDRVLSDRAGSREAKTGIAP
jgi:FSR family fosmidomycin resistance protein-like MFS transporter